MYGVRVMDGSRQTDLKIFRWLSEAQEWMRSHDHGTYDIALVLEVPGADTRATVEAIKRMDAEVVLIECQESPSSIEAAEVRRRRREIKKLVERFGGATRTEIQAKLLAEAEEARIAALNVASVRAVR